jgi:DNA-binding transcriptional MerR regulator
MRLEQVFSIKDAAFMCGVSPQTLRNWEALGYIPRVRRGQLNKVRIFTMKDIESIIAFIGSTQRN